MNKNNKVLILSELSISIILSLFFYFEFKIFTALNGGSVTLEVLPLFIFAFKNNFKYSAICVIIYSIFKLMFSFYFPPLVNFKSIFLCIFFDYILSYFFISLSSVFNFFLNKKLKFSKKKSYFITIILILIFKFIIHFLSGIIIWSLDSLNNSIRFSFLYNLSYCLPEGIFVTLILAMIHRDSDKIE